MAESQVGYSLLLWPIGLARGQRRVSRQIRSTKNQKKKSTSPRQFTTRDSLHLRRWWRKNSERTENKFVNTELINDEKL